MKKEAIYNWCSFQQSFSKKLVFSLLEELDVSDKMRVFDPFVGSGTTILACKQKNIEAKGIDIIPYAVFISNVKIRNYIALKLRECFEEINFDEIERNLHIPEIPILKKSFKETTLVKILSLKKKIRKVHDRVASDFFMLALLSLVEKFSYTKKGGAFLRTDNEKLINDNEIYPQFKNKVASMIKDVMGYEALFSQNGKWQANLCDARNFKGVKIFDAVISSPPYLNRHDYTRIFSLELLLHFVKDNDELKQIRYNTFRSHVEAKKPNTFEPYGYRKPEKLKRILKNLEESKLPNRQIIPMIEGYFEDMYLTLKQVSKHLKKNGKVAFVLGNVRYSGITIPVDMIIAEIGELTGFKLKDIWTLKNKGNSPQQMKIFGKKTLSENVIIWEKNKNKL